MPTLDDLTQLLYRHDPIGLVHHGVPRDEYRSEAETVLPRLPEAASVADVQRILHEEFVAWFGDVAGESGRYVEPATELWGRLAPA